MSKLRLIILIIIYFISHSLLLSQNISEDRIPLWVKENITQEEYKLWERMSRLFTIDYSFITNKNMKAQKKDKLYESIKRLLDKYENNEDIKRNASMVFVPVVMNNDFCKVTFTVYRSKLNKNGYINVHANFIYNAETEKITNIHSEVIPVGIIPPYNGGNNVPNSQFKMIQGAVSGSFRITENNLIDEDFSNALYFILPL